MKNKNLIGLFLIVAFLLSACELVGNTLLVRTADPKVGILITLPEVSLLPTITPTPKVLPEEETGEAVPEPTLVAPSLDIKGNISSSGEKIYHIPGGASYDQVRIDESKGEKWFRTEEEAIAAGWRKAQR